MYGLRSGSPGRDRTPSARVKEAEAAELDYLYSAHAAGDAEPLTGDEDGLDGASEPQPKPAVKRRRTAPQATPSKTQTAEAVANYVSQTLLLHGQGVPSAPVLQVAARSGATVFINLATSGGPGNDQSKPTIRQPASTTTRATGTKGDLEHVDDDGFRTAEQMLRRSRPKQSTIGDFYKPASGAPGKWWYERSRRLGDGNGV